MIMYVFYGKNIFRDTKQNNIYICKIESSIYAKKTIMSCYIFGGELVLTAGRRGV